MKFLIPTIRVLANLIYCVLIFAAAIMIFFVLWGAIAGMNPLGALAHGAILLNLPFLLVILPIIGCDIYCRRNKRYPRRHDKS